MSYLKAQLFLSQAARNYHREKLSFSKEEINKKIQQIKYLSLQKKVPKLTLRKEIMHLEQKLSSISQLETRMLQKKQQESAKILALKKHIATLKKQLAASSDQDLNKRVDKLSHLLAGYLAQKEVEKSSVPTRQPVVKNRTVTRNYPLQRDESARLKELEARIEAIKRKLPFDSPIAKQLQEKIDLIEQKLNVYRRKRKPEKEQKPVADVNVKHKMMFSVPLKKDQQEGDYPENKYLQAVEELPLPPPPKRS